jgi:ribosomal protein L24E
MGHMMPLPPWTKHMKVRITSPADGIVVKANSVELGVSVSGYTDSCDFAGKPVVQGEGHYHVLIDKELVNMFCTSRAVVSMQNMDPGKHTISVVPALDDHAEVLKNERSITIDYEPTNPLPPINDESSAATPSIEILSPHDGQTLVGRFDVTVRITNYRTSCNLMGKPDVVGWGHWHVNLDSMIGPMEGMGTMLGMSCTRVFHGTTAGLKAGQTHTIIALLTDNTHVPIQPPVFDSITVHIG